MKKAPSDESDVSHRLQDLLERGEADVALELLHERYEKDVLRFARFRRPLDPPEDICQEAWLAVQKGLSRFRFDSTPRAWLLSIVARKVADSHRRGGRHRRDVQFDSRDLLLASFPMAPRRPSTPLSKLERARRLSLLEATLQAWDPADRELLELRFVCDLKPAEIVEVLGLDVLPNTISQRLVRLVQRLRQQLGRHDLFAS